MNVCARALVIVRTCVHVRPVCGWAGTPAIARHCEHSHGRQQVRLCMCMCACTCMCMYVCILCMYVCVVCMCIVFFELFFLSPARAYLFARVHLLMRCPLLCSALFVSYSARCVVCVYGVGVLSCQIQEIWELCITFVIRRFSAADGGEVGGVWSRSRRSRGRGRGWSVRSVRSSRSSGSSSSRRRRSRSRGRSRGSRRRSRRSRSSRRRRRSRSSRRRSSRGSWKQ